MVGLPSTDWVGKDIADFLVKNHEIIYFDSFHANVETDVIFIIKLMPPLDWIIKLKKSNVKLIYIPVDHFYRPEILIRDKVKVACFDSIAVHNLRLGELLSPFASEVFEIDHYLKYSVEKTNHYKKEGFILWIGHIEYIPPLLQSISVKPFPHPIKLLVDLENIETKRIFLQKILAKNGLQFTLEKLDDDRYKLNGYILEQWSAVKQRNYLQLCKAAFDTKGDNFAHNLKPPTKAQKYIYNQIPFAIDEHAYAKSYFSERGLTIPSIEEHERWFSEEYFDEIKLFVESNILSQKLEYVANSYIDIVNKTTIKPIKNSIINLILKNIYYKVSYLLRRLFSQLQFGS
jgi:hypothetical protein